MHEDIHDLITFKNKIICLKLNLGLPFLGHPIAFCRIAVTLFFAKHTAITVRKYKRTICPKRSRWTS